LKNPSATLRANRRLAAVVLGVMLLMAGIGLAYALQTEAFRRANDKGLVKRPSRRQPAQPADTDPGPAKILAPARLAGLGYLLPGTTAVAGIHVQELLATQTGRKFLETKWKVGPFAFRLTDLKKWTGLSLDEIDHAVLGSKADEPFPPPTVVVLRTRGPLDLEKIRIALDARPKGGGNRKWYAYKAAGSSLSLVLWHFDDRTLLIALLPKHFKDVPPKPVEDLSSLAAPTKTILEERIGLGTSLWLAGHSEDWTNGALGLLTDQFPKADLATAKSVRAVALWAEAAKAPIVQGAISCNNTDATKRLGAFYVPKWKKSWPGLTVVQESEWLSLQAKIELECLRKFTDN
jgi:hypothetical protein